MPWDRKKHRYVSLPPAPPLEGQHETPVAVCINGVARTLHLPIVYRSLAQNLLRPLGAGVVSFASLTMHELHSVETGFNGGHEVVHAERRSLEVALEALNVSNANRRLRREDPSREELLGLLANAPRCLGRHIRHRLVTSALAQLLNAQLCVDLVRTHEAQHLRDGFRRLVHVRPDASWVLPLPAGWSGLDWTGPAAWQARALLVSSMREGFQDWAAFGGREAMLSWFGRLAWANESCIAAGDAANGESSTEARMPLLASLPLFEALPIGIGLTNHFRQRLRVSLIETELPTVIVRPSIRMPSARGACEVKAAFFDFSPARCQQAIYDAGAGGGASRNMTGAWW